MSWTKTLCKAPLSVVSDREWPGWSPRFESGLAPSTEPKIRKPGRFHFRVQGVPRGGGTEMPERGHYNWVSRQGRKRVFLDSEKWNFPSFQILGSADGREGRKSGRPGIRKTLCKKTLG